MASLVYFTSVNNLKERSTFDMNIEDKIIESSIYDAQEIDIQNITGSRLYLALKAKVIANTVTGVYKTLMDSYIEPTLLKFAQKRALIFVYAKIRNKSVSTADSDNSTPVDIEILNKIRQEILSDAEFYSNKCKDFLHEHRTDYPEYDDPNPDGLEEYNSPSGSDSYFTGLQLDSDYDCHSRRNWDSWRNEQ